MMTAFAICCPNKLSSKLVCKRDRFLGDQNLELHLSPIILSKDSKWFENAVKARKGMTKKVNRARLTVRSFFSLEVGCFMSETLIFLVYVRISLKYLASTVRKSDYYTVMHTKHIWDNLKPLLALSQLIVLFIA